MTLFLSIIFAWALFLPLLSGDLGWHLRVGEYVLTWHSVPRLNFLCFPALWYPWITHEWLAGTLFALIEHFGGLGALFWTRAALFVGTLWLLYWLGRRRDAEPLALAGLTLLAAVTLALHVSLRPWLFSNFLLAVALLLSQQAQLLERPTRPFFWLTLLLGLWINLHGGFVVGVGLFALLVWNWMRDGARRTGRFGTLRRLPQGLGWGIALLFVLLLNPHGVEALALPLRYLLGEETTGLAMTSELKEWAPIELSSFFGGVYLLWALLGLLAMIRSPLARRKPEALLGIAFLVLTLQSQRHLPLVALFLFPVICEGLLEPLHHRLRAARGRVGLFVAGLSRLETPLRLRFFAIASALISVLFWQHTQTSTFEPDAFHAKGYPLELVRALELRPPGRLFNHYDWAGLVAWQAPSWTMFITPVNDAYPVEVFEDWRVIANRQEGWRTRMERARVDTVLMPTSSLLVERLKQDPDWQIALEQEGATLLVKSQVLP